MKSKPKARSQSFVAALFAVPFLMGVANAAVGIGLEDVQVGERNLQTRIALICDGPCSIEKRADEQFFLRGVSSDMTLDLSDRSKNIEGFELVPDRAGSVMSVKPARLIEYANAKPCVIAERAATCIDLFFADAKPREAKIATPVLNASLPKTAPPALRESAPERLSRFAALAPPERLAPPTGARLASVQPVQNPPVPTLREREVVAPAEPQRTQQQSANAIQTGARAPQPAEGFNYAEKVKALLGKNLSPGYCASAKANLQSDAWALESMVDVGLCEAAAGNAELAETMLSRLLEYTPDNYEAHVGRALIALQAGEKSVARRYFQDALDAPPPIEESTRIVEAMRAL
ncbi:tetratricopeptide repeat protein [Hyphococcus sp. DH-69]|uniref:tetratricopeptide repeat protein n=1 Tax=Hyphococcus formosus TaxID=3143534 RepID=UPI00398B0346